MTSCSPVNTTTTTTTTTRPRLEIVGGDAGDRDGVGKNTSPRLE